MDEGDLGLSLTELSETYAALLGSGNDPYSPLPEPPDPLGRSISDLASSPIVSATTAGQDDAGQVTPGGIVEAMLFVGHPGNQPLESSQIAALMRGVSAAEIDDTIQELNQRYERCGAAYRIESIGPGYRMVLRPEFEPLADKFLGRVREARLAQSVIDVLAIVAYGQPISREDVDRLRGRPCGAILGQLIRRDLLRIERPEGDRRNVRYLTTERFLELFGLDSLADLPRSPDDRGL